MAWKDLRMRNRQEWRLWRSMGGPIWWCPGRRPKPSPPTHQNKKPSLAAYSAKQYPAPQDQPVHPLTNPLTDRPPGPHAHHATHLSYVNTIDIWRQRTSSSESRTGCCTSTCRWWRSPRIQLCVSSIERWRGSSSIILHILNTMIRRGSSILGPVPIIDLLYIFSTFLLFWQRFRGFFAGAYGVLDFLRLGSQVTVWEGV